MTWRRSRPPEVRPGRPYVLRRRVMLLGPRWLVLTVDDGIVTSFPTLPEAHDYAAALAVWRGAERAERRGVGS